MVYGTLAEDTQPLLQRPEYSQRSMGYLYSSQRSADVSSVSRVNRRTSVLAGILKGKRNRQLIAEGKQGSDALHNSGSSSPQRNTNLKSFLYTTLNPRSNAWQALAFKWFISIVIATDLVMFVVSTEPDLSDEQIQQFQWWEGLTSTIFLIEYLARLITVTEAKKYKEKGIIWGRLSYATTFPALIDLAATVPFFLERVFGLDLPTLTYLRAFRLLRILKTSGFAEATKAVNRVIYYNRQILYVALFICFGLVLLTSVLMYYLRPQGPDGDHDDFKSIGSTMYISTLMLTGQGGPDGNLPWYTKGVVLMTGVVSIGMFAIPASMLTWGFEAEAERVARLAYTGSKQGVDDDEEHDTWSYSSEDSDEEYFKVIAGVDEDDEEGADARAMEAFVNADKDRSGNISLTEFLALSREQNQSVADNAFQTTEKLASRLASVERKVEENSKKLDKICQLLEALQTR